MEDFFGWLRPGGSGRLDDLKSRKELNGEAVNIESKDSTTGRWRCKLIRTGEVLKVKATNLIAPVKIVEPTEEADSWHPQRGNNAMVTGRGDLEGQHVRILSVGTAGECRCVVRTTGEQVTIGKADLRPLAGKSDPEVSASGSSASDWGKMEQERQRMAEGFRLGFDEGAIVELRGLRSAADLNGKRGRLVKFDRQSLRWLVEVAGSQKALNPTNLVPVPGSVDDGEGSGAPPEKKARADDLADEQT